MEGVAIFTEEQINRLVEAAVGRAVDMLKPKKEKIVKEQPEYITTDEVKKLLKIKSTKALNEFRKRHKIHPAIYGRPNKYLKSDFYGFKK